MTSKSLYQNQLKVTSDYEVDDLLERARVISLQGKVSYEKCLLGVAQVGSNLYMMSPAVEVDSSNVQLHGNGLTVVNGYNRRYHFPHSMTLFQPSGKEYDSYNLAKDSEGRTNFIDWCDMHSRKTSISLLDDYGGTESKLKCYGKGSYELELATYSPTDLILTT